MVKGSTFYWLSAPTVRLGLEPIRRGIFVVPGAKMYLSLAHTDEDIQATLAAFSDALRASD